MKEKSTFSIRNRIRVKFFLITSLFVVLNCCGCTFYEDSQKGISASDNPITEPSTNTTEDETRSTNNESVTEDDDWYFNENEVIIWSGSMSGREIGKSDFQYEREAANCYYKGSPDEEIQDNEHNSLVYELGRCSFDKNGNGVFVIEDPEGFGMQNHMYFFEYTTDYGKTWNVSEGYFSSSYAIGSPVVKGDRVLMVGTSLIKNKSVIFYSDDMCKTIRRCDIAAHLPLYRSKLLYRTKNMEILSFDQNDGSVILGIYDEKTTSYPSLGNYPNYGEEKKEFLIVKADKDFENFDVLYADDQYIDQTRDAWMDD